MRLPHLISVAFAILSVLATRLEAAPQESIPPGLLERMRQVKTATSVSIAAAEKPTSEPAKAPLPMRPRQVFGEVVDARGEPVAGVGVILGSLKSLVTTDCLDRPLARTDAKGHFEFTLPPPPVVPPPPKTAAKPAVIGPPEFALTEKAAAALRQEIAKTVAGEYIAADLAAAKAIEAAKNAAAAAQEAIARRKYLLLCGESRVALRLTMPKVDHAAMTKLREPRTVKEKAAKVGIDVLARTWGRDAAPKKDGIDLRKITTRKGVILAGRVVDGAGKAVEGARVTAVDLMTAGRYRGVSASRNRRGFTATPTSYAISGKDGRFRVPGVFATGSQITIRAEGFFDEERSVVGAAPLAIRVSRSGLVEGRLVRNDGGVATGTVKVSYEVSSAAHVVKVEKDGSFAFHPKHPNRFRLAVKPTGETAKKYLTTYSPVLDGPQPDLVVDLVAKKKPKPKTKKPPKRAPRLGRWARAAKRGVVVSVVDGATDRPLRDFQAKAIWVRANYNATDSYYMGRFNSKPLKSKQPGYIRLPGPSSESAPKGAVIVKAPGYAPFVQMGLEFEPGNPPRVTARMVAESILGGYVGDVGDEKGDGIRSATVLLYRLTKSGRTGRAVSARTDALGHFTFKGLRKGRYRLLASQGRRQAKSVEVGLGAEEKRGDIRLTIGRATRLTGRVTGVRPGEGWQVELLSANNAMVMFYNPTSRRSGTKAKLNEDGSFEFVGVKEGFYEVSLNIPRDAREGPPIQVPVEPIRIRENRDAHVLVDASEDLPGRLTGKITMTGAKLDFARLMAIAVPYVPTSPYSYYGYSNIDITGARSRVATDGTFAFTVANGKIRIKILDVITGVLLYQSETPIEVESGETKIENLALALTRVNVKLEPTKEGGRVTAAWLNIDVEQPRPEALQMFMFFNGNNGKRATGVPLVGDVSSIQLVLPAYKTRFEVYSNVARLSRAKSKPRSTLGDAEITPKLGEANEVKIEVDVPTTGFDEEPVDTEEDEQMGDGLGQRRKKVKAAVKVLRATGKEAGN